MKDLFRYNSILPSCMQAGVKHKFSCSGCNSTYVGMTKRHLRTHACEHMGVSALTGVAIKTAFSSVLDHLGLLKTEPESNIDDFRILYKLEACAGLPNCSLPHPS